MLFNANFNLATSCVTAGSNYQLRVHVQKVLQHNYSTQRRYLFLPVFACFRLFLPVELSVVMAMSLLDLCPTASVIMASVQIQTKFIQTNQNNLIK